MKLKELLLSRQTFVDLLKQFAFDADQIKIQDEEVLFSEQYLKKHKILKENICIEGRNQDGVVNFFGTLHYNIIDKLAVFEVLGFERKDLVY